MIDPKDYQRLTAALEQYIAIRCFSDPSMHVKIMDLRERDARNYSGIAIANGHMRIPFQAEIYTEGASVQAVYLCSSFLIAYLKDQFQPTIDNALLEPLVRKEVKRMLRKILDL